MSKKEQHIYSVFDHIFFQGSIRMKNLEPFLFRFKKESISLSRVGMNEADDYDSSLDMMICFEDGKRIPVIDSTKAQRRTKKEDMEKGEDQKDSLMWR